MGIHISTNIHVRVTFNQLYEFHTELKDKHRESGQTVVARLMHFFKPNYMEYVLKLKHR